jgi:hypothetical protein
MSGEVRRTLNPNFPNVAGEVAVARTIPKCASFLDGRGRRLEGERERRKRAPYFAENGDQVAEHGIDGSDAGKSSTGEETDLQRGGKARCGDRVRRGEAFPSPLIKREAKQYLV